MKFSRDNGWIINTYISTKYHIWGKSGLSMGLTLRGRILHTIHPSIVRGQGTPWTSRQLIAGPSLMADCTSGAIWGSVSCSRTLLHAAKLSLELGFEPATFQSLANLLYPLPPHITCCHFVHCSLIIFCFFSVFRCSLVRLKKTRFGVKTYLSFRPSVSS